MSDEVSWLLRAHLRDDPAGAEGLTRVFTPHLVQVTAAIQQARIRVEGIVAGAIAAGLASVSAQRRGDRGRGWDATSFGALLLNEILVRLGNAAVFRPQDGFAGLSRAERAALLLVDVESLTIAEAGELLVAPPAEVAEHYEQAESALALEPIVASRCPIWSLVYRRTRLDEDSDDAEVVRTHVASCGECSDRNARRRDRRKLLVERADDTDWGLLAAAWDRRYLYT